MRAVWWQRGNQRRLVAGRKRWDASAPAWIRGSLGVEQSVTESDAVYVAQKDCEIADYFPMKKIK